MKNLIRSGLSLGLFLAMSWLVTGDSPACAADAPNRALLTYVNALQALAEGKFPKGVQLYFKSILFDEVPLSKAVRENDLKKSIAHFQREKQAGKVGEASVLSIVLIDRILGKYDPAVSGLDALRARHPVSAFLAFLRGEFELARGNPDKAKVAFDALKTLPKPRSFPALARAVLERRGASVAITDPGARRASLLKIAFQRWDEMDHPGAEKQFRAILAEFPEDVETGRALIEMLIQDDRAQEAAVIVDGWKGASAEPLVTPFNLLRIRYAQGRYAEVASMAKPLMEADPRDIYLKTITAESFFLSERLDLAAPLFEELVAADPMNQGFLQRFLACLEVCGNPAKAVAPLEKYLAATPGDSFMRFEFAVILLRLNRLDESRRIFVELKDGGEEFSARAEEKIAAIDALTFEQVRDHVAAGSQTDSGGGFPAVPPGNPDEGAPDGQMPAVDVADIETTDADKIKQMQELYK